MTINAALLRQTLGHVEAHPGEWAQSSWRSRNGLCFGTWACELAGGRFVYDDPNHPRSHYLVPEPDDAPGDVDTLDDQGARGVHATVRARRILGLTDEQAMRLFAGANDRGRLIVIVSQLCQEAA